MISSNIIVEKHFFKRTSTYANSREETHVIIKNPKIWMI